MNSDIHERLGLCHTDSTDYTDDKTGCEAAKSVKSVESVCTKKILPNGKIVKPYILLSAHREENIDTEKNFRSLFNAINAMAEKYDMPILYSCHPRSRKRLEASGFKLDPRVIQHEPLGFHDYNCLQMNAYCVVSDSGTLPEESSFFTSIGHPFLRCASAPVPNVPKRWTKDVSSLPALTRNRFCRLLRRQST